MSLYVGQNGTPKKVSKLLVGVNGTAKEVKTGYTGNASSNSQLVYQSFNKETDFGKTNPVQLLTSGLITSDDIGRTVYLSNSTTSCQEWIVIGVNHDNTSGTVDLRSKYIALDRFYKASTDYNSTITIDYNTTGIRNTINSSFYNGFADSIKNAMKIMEVKFYDQNLSTPAITTYNDKVKLPSMTELGIRLWDNGSTSWSDHKAFQFADEGQVYPYYGTSVGTIGNTIAEWQKYLIKKPNGANDSYFCVTRSSVSNRGTSVFPNSAAIWIYKSSNDLYTVQQMPAMVGDNGFDELYFDAAPIIRFGK